MIRVCFVADELQPFASGERARLLHGLAERNARSASPAQFHYLLPSVRRELADPLKEIYGADRIHFAPDAFPQSDLLGRLLGGADWEGEEPGDAIARSLSLYYGLQQAQDRIRAPFDYVEFPDRGGWAAASIAARRAGFEFGETRIVVRLQSGFGLILPHQPHTPANNRHAAATIDFERAALRHADLVVAPLAATADEARDCYRFDDAWRTRCRIEFPPILSGQESTPDAQPAEAGPDFVFLPPLQPHRRPDVFIRAAILFLEEHSGYSGAFRLMLDGADPAYVDTLRPLVPGVLARRILFQAQHGTSLQDIAVVPSDYEGLGLSAYEIAAQGGRVILNRRCMAFGSSPRWQDGRNCLMFDGMPFQLAEAMATAPAWTPQDAVETAPDPAYWETALEPPAPMPRSSQRLAVCVFGIDTAEQLTRLLLRFPFGLLDTVHLLLPRDVFPDGDRSVLEAIARGATPHLVPGPATRPSDIAHVVTSLDAELVALFAADHVPHEAFLGSGLHAFDADPALQLFTSHVRVLDSAGLTVLGTRLYAGEAPSIALLENCVAPPAVIILKALLRTCPPDDRVGDLWFEELTRRAAVTGEDILVAPAALIDALDASARTVSSPDITAALLRLAGPGSPARYFAPDTAGTSASGADLVFESTVDDFRAAHMAWPRDVDRAWSPVAYNAEMGGLLVHPIMDHVTIAALPPLRAQRVWRISARVRNAHAGNQGIEAAMALLRRDLTAERLAALEQYGEADGAIVSPWLSLAPDSSGVIELQAERQMPGDSRLLLMTRLPPGTGESFCWAVFETVTAFS